jgi:methylglutamate dehydrogenase subunit D
VSDLVLTARAALGLLAQPGHYGNLAAEPGLVISERRDLGMASIMARKGQTTALSAAAEAAFGAALPQTPRRVEGNGIAFVWAGPERWLALAHHRSSEDLARLLSGVVAAMAAITAQGDGRAVFRLGGPSARDVLAKGLAIDLHPRAFRPGDTAVTAALHLEVQIWQCDDRPTYEIALFRGFARSFWLWLAQAASPYGYLVEA